MKTITLLFATLVSLSGFSQQNATWVFSGLQRMDKSMSAISTQYSDDHYSLVNYPTFRGEIMANNHWYRFDMSGLFYFIIASSKENEPAQGFNVESTTDHSFEAVQDRCGLEFISTKLRSSEKPFNYGIGWQAGFRTFGFSDKGLLKTNLAINPGYPDPGAYSLRSTLSAGMNVQFFKAFGNFVDLRTGLFVNGLAGVQKYGGMVYPEVAVNLHFWRIAVMGTLAYETTYVYSPTHKIFTEDPADNSGLVHGPRLEVAVGLNLHR